MSDRRTKCSGPCRSSFAEFFEELVRLNEEWILLKNAPDDDYRMGPDDVDDDVSAKPGEIIRADDRVRVPGPHLIDLCLELQQKIDTRSLFQGPFGVRDVSTDGKPVLSTTLEHIFEQRELSIRIEGAIAEECIGPVMQFKLAGPLRRGCIDPGGCHALEMIDTSCRIDDMERLVAAFESVFDERKRYVVLVLTAVEEGANMTSLAKH
jgi:hypothetical protein